MPVKTTVRIIPVTLTIEACNQNGDLVLTAVTEAVVKRRA
jgi:hypothetical protein